MLVESASTTNVIIVISTDNVTTVTYGNITEPYRELCDNIAYAKAQIAKFGWRSRGYFPPAPPVLTMRCTARPAPTIRIRRPRTRAPRRAPYSVTR